MIIIKTAAAIILILLIILGILLFFPAYIKIKSNKTKTEADICAYFGILKIKLSFLGNNTDEGLYIFGKKIKRSKKKKEKKHKPPNNKPYDEGESKNEPPSGYETESNDMPEDENLTKNEKKSELGSLFEKICGEASDIYEYINLFSDLIYKKNIKTAGRRLMNNVMNFAEYKKVDLNINFGFEDPAETGIVYGFLCAAFHNINPKPCIKPDFNNKIFDFSLYIKIRFNICKLIIFVVKLSLDKEISEIIGMFNKNDEQTD